jgi:CBS domain-containing protein
MSGSRRSAPAAELRRVVYAVPATLSVSRLERLLAAQRTRAVIIVRGRKPIGIVTAHDLSHRVLPIGLTTSSARVTAVMSSPVVTISVRETVNEAIARMTQGGFHHLPIVSEQGHLVALLTWEDAQDLYNQGIQELEGFARGSIILTMRRRTWWRRVLDSTRQMVRTHWLWWLAALGLALVGGVLAVGIGTNWERFWNYQPPGYEPKDISRQQYLEHREQSPQARPSGGP